MDDFAAIVAPIRDLDDSLPALFADVAEMAGELLACGYTVEQVVAVMRGEDAD